MTFSEFSDFLSQLEKTSSRLALIDVLSKLFKKVKAGEIAKVCYLIQGRVAPFYEPLEIGMSEKLVAQAMARAYGKNREEILREYGRLGDLGLVAEGLSVRHSGKRSQVPNGTWRSASRIDSGQARMTVTEVFNTLTEIAKTTGEGTVEKKILTLAELLKKVDGQSARHLVRIPLGTTRLGIGDPTILDAFALCALGDRKKRPLLEGAYNRVSDLGLIGETLWRGGISAVQKLKVTVGRPIRSELAERLPTAQKVIEKLGKVNAQRKLDGFRVQIHKDGEHVRLFSRNLEETTPMFPEIAEGARKQIKTSSVILDAEAIGFNPNSDEFLPFQETTQRRRKYGIPEMAKKIPLKAFVFDILYKNGKSLIDEPLSKRLKILKDTLGDGDILFAEIGEVVDKVDKLQMLLDDAISKGLEGLVVKRLDSKYEAGARNFNWVKLKRHSSGELKDTIDCVILGYIYGRGKRAEFGAGALLVGLYDDRKDEFVTVSKIGTGLTDEEWRKIHKRADKIKVDKKPARVRSKIEPSVWIKPEIVVEVLADEITRSPVHTAGKTDTEPGYALRFPRLVSFRSADKKPEDATTVKELIEMYKQQKGDK